MRSYLERSARVWQKICAVGWQTASKVLAHLASLSPDGSDEDVWLVWHELEKRHPQDAEYAYTDSQICWAWWVVRRARWRQDHHGAGGRRVEAARRRRRALGRLARELKVREVDVIQLSFDDYDASHRLLSVAGEFGHQSVVLSLPTARALSNWVKIRGSHCGPLFEFPQVTEYWEESGFDQRQVHDRRAAIEPACQAEQEETVELLCRGKPPLACAFVLENICDKGGDWSDGIRQRLIEYCGTFVGHVFTKGERRACVKVFTSATRCGQEAE